MTIRPETPARAASPASAARGIFLQPAGPCWCADEAFRLPMPADASDCLCRDCLRQGCGARREARRQRDWQRWNVSAVLLDMDGTLLDTERVYFESLVAALNSRGYTDDVASLCHAMVGLPGPECEALLIAQYGEDFPLAAISRAFVANRDRNFTEGTAVEGWRRRAARCAAGRRMPDGDRDLVVAAQCRCASDVGGNPNPL